MKLISIYSLFFLAFAAFPLKSDFTQVVSVENQITSIFGKSIYFTAEIVSDAPIKAATLLFQAEGDSRVNVGLANVSKIAPQTYRVSYIHRLTEYAIRPFSIIQFHWELVFAVEDMTETPVEELIYDDNQFNWQVREQGNFRIHWVEGDRQFAQDIISIAEDGVNKINGLISLPDPGEVDIYIYPNSESMQSALSLESEDWIAAHTDPELGVIMVALPKSPEQTLLAEQRIPHELMHILLFRETGIGYQNLPVWMKEGLASAAELYPNPEYRIILDGAAKQGELLPIVQLCEGFPRDAVSIRLAYAESQAYVQHLQRTIGAPGLQSLITAYSNGMDCESGAQHALGMSLKQSERGWRQDSLPINDTWRVPIILIPWIILLMSAVGAPLLFGILRLRKAEET